MGITIKQFNPINIIKDIFLMVKLKKYLKSLQKLDDWERYGFKLGWFGHFDLLVEIEPVNEAKDYPLLLRSLVTKEIKPAIDFLTEGSYDIGMYLRMEILKTKASYVFRVLFSPKLKSFDTSFFKTTLTIIMIATAAIITKIFIF